MALLYLDGRIMDEKRARIPATDPALAWGVGVFEVARGYNQKAFQLDTHLGRLRRSAEHFGIQADVPALDEVVHRLFVRNGLPGGYTRITLTGGGHLVVVTQPWKALPRRIYRQGAALAVAPFRRDPAAPLAGHKTLNYLENMKTRWEAEGEGVLDALVLGLRGEVLEGTRCNVFMVEKGRLITPPLGKGILPGVTRKVVIDLAREQGLRVTECRLHLSRLFAAEEVFVTSTMMEIVPVVRIAERCLPGPGPVARSLLAAYHGKVSEECGKK